MRAPAAIVGLVLVALVGASRATAQEPAREASVTAGQPGASIQFDSRGVDFTPWLREFIPKVRSAWLIPVDAVRDSGHVVVSFSVGKSGEITKVKIKERSRIDVFNEASRTAIVRVGTAPTLPKAYPRDRCSFVVTFFYNEAPLPPK